jgi:adenosylcobinamide-GDP ribazoletransferase
VNPLKSALLAFSLFSTLPLPRPEWNPGNLRHVLAAFPLVGLAIGLAILLWFLAADGLGLGPVLLAAGATALPVVLTGGLHLDGLADTVDALACPGGPGRRREVLRDPHVGAFAVLALSLYLLLFFALASELPANRGAPPALILLFPFSRALAGLLLATLPCSPASGLGRTLRDASPRPGTRIILSLALFGLGLGMALGSGWPGLAAALAALGAAAPGRWRLPSRFGGFSGDLAGCILQLAELAGLAGLVLGGKLWPEA